ncbi:MAG: glycine cleavage system protein GcvH [Lachnospiraceae bacterium]|nr:glycine cleavage system protein GcvH [Lachnospiraceae bacterium]
MNIPAELKYSKTHEWVKMLDETTALVGITDYAQDALGDVVFVDIPETGDAVTAGESFTDVESVKAVSEVISPVSGEIAEVNEALDEAPELLNQDCYESWIIKVSGITVSGITETEELLDAAAYEEYLKTCEEEE